MLNSPLEFLARSYENVVRYDADGVPSLYVKFPKMKSSDLDASLPAHTHPAFIVNGEEQDAILLGKYNSVLLSDAEDEAAHSMPGMPPMHTRTADDMLARMRAGGDGASGMTAADRGFLLLLAQKNGWTPKGNSAYGHDAHDAAAFMPGRSVKVGDRVGYRGMLYESLKTHMTSSTLAPDKAATHWKLIRRIGGTEAYPDLHSSGQNNVLLTMNASGPMNWYLDGTPAGVCDLVGGQGETDYGYRIVDGELQVLEDNDAADPSADLSAESGAWRAIVPSGTDESCTLAAPGTAGTLKWRYANGKITLGTTAPTFDNVKRETAFRDLATDLAHVPALVRELGLFPTEGSETDGICAVTFARGELYPRCGGDYSSGEAAGLGCIECAYGRDKSGAYYGARMRTMEEK